MKDRRNFLRSGVQLVPAILASGYLSAIAAEKAEVEEEVSPAEDLMREHGALNRILLIYDEIGHRLREGHVVEPKTIITSAELIRTFIENYHEKLEEQFLFPRFEKAKQLTDLVAVLRQQHQAGQQLTALILNDSQKISSSKADSNQQIAHHLELFTRMYRPHEAREDTILFPAFRQLVSEKAYKELGEQFEDKEHELFGKEGFENTVKIIAGLERELGIYDLAQFTPKLTESL